MSLSATLAVPILLFLGTFAIGVLPLYYASRSPSEKALALMSQLGLGMLLGVAFMLVIPEGLERAGEKYAGLDLLVGFLVTFLAESWKKVAVGTQGVAGKVLGNSVVVALTVHAIADGLVLGVAAGEIRMLLVLLVAVVVHRIPVVLSLVSVLVSRQRLPRKEVTGHLLLFSVASPVGYLIALLFSAFGVSSGFSGHLLLASGGSLLYAGFALRGNANCENGSETAQKDLMRPSPTPGFGREGSDGFVVLEPPALDPEPRQAPGPLWVVLGALLPAIISWIGSDD